MSDRFIAQQSAAPLSRQPGLASCGSAALLVLVALWAFVWVGRRGQDLNFDLLNYHFFSGYSLLSGREAMDLAGAGLQSFFHPWINALAYLAFAKLAFPWSAWLILAVQLLSLPFLWLIGRRLAADAGLPGHSPFLPLALLVSLLAPLWWSELGTSFFSSSTTPLLLAALWLGLAALAGERHARSRALLAGLLFGFASGLKLTNAVFAVAFCAGIAFQLPHRPTRRPFLVLLACLGAGGILGFALTASWYFDLWRQWENPFFPLFNAVFHSPYFDQSNWRDMRWHFASLGDFGRFLLAAGRLTGKTSEVPFADLRLPLLACLVIAAFFRRNGQACWGAEARVFMGFATVSFALWAHSLAYQRYLIPLELLLGPVFMLAWLRLFGQSRPSLALACVFPAVCMLAIKVPDWGHLPRQRTAPAPFAIAVPAEMAASPARYMLLGQPLSFVLPFLHPGSSFVGFGISQGLDEAGYRKLQSLPELPLRTLTPRANSRHVWSLLAPLGLNPQNTRLACQAFAAPFSGTVDICEATRQASAPAAMQRIDIDFSDRARPGQPNVLEIGGLHPAEAWGAWSSAPHVRLLLANCLPPRGFSLSLDAKAFGPAAGKPLTLSVGGEEAQLTLSDDFSSHTRQFRSKDPCPREISLRIPAQASPASLGMSTDSRQLGIGLRRLAISADGA